MGDMAGSLAPQRELRKLGDNRKAASPRSADARKESPKDRAMRVPAAEQEASRRENPTDVVPIGSEDEEMLCSAPQRI
jgi:hypothetical protein